MDKTCGRILANYAQLWPLEIRILHRLCEFSQDVYRLVKGADVRLDEHMGHRESRRSTGKVFFVLPVFLGSTGKGLNFVLPVFLGSTGKGLNFVLPVFIGGIGKVFSILPVSKGWIGRSPLYFLFS